MFNQNNTNFNNNPNFKCFAMLKNNNGEHLLLDNMREK